MDRAQQLPPIVPPAPHPRRENNQSFRSKSFPKILIKPDTAFPFRTAAGQRPAVRFEIVTPRLVLVNTAIDAPRPLP